MTLLPLSATLALLAVFLVCAYLTPARDDPRTPGTLEAALGAWPRRLGGLALLLLPLAIAWLIAALLDWPLDWSS